MRTAAAVLAVLAAGVTAASCSSADSATVGNVSTASSLVGTWQRTNSCSALVKEFRQAKLQSQIRDWLVGAGYFQSPSQVHASTPCKGAQNLKHSHFFTAQGAFGSYDQNGKQVDNGNYKITAPGTLAFPSHVKDFGYKIKVHYAITHGKLRFAVVIPHPCTGKCPGATAWAISGFYAGPVFTRSK